jgi:tetratricopeptide (TPR) repeat protein
MKKKKRSSAKASSKPKATHTPTSSSKPKAAQPTAAKPTPKVEEDSSSMGAALILIGALVGGIGLGAWVLWPSKNHVEVPDLVETAPPPPVEPFVMEPEDAVFATYAGSETCADCHREEYDKWIDSNHGLAERAPRDDLDLVGFHPPMKFEHGSQSTETRKEGKDYELVSLGFDNKREPYEVERVIGHDPLRQFLVHGERGRLHAMEACWDPHAKEWFNVYGDEDRQPGEWGHWTGRGMVWNQMCASCHNTRVRKNYDLESDGYHTSMAELTVSCESCHGPMKAHVDWQHEYPLETRQEGDKDPTIPAWTRDQHIDNCAGCHARRGEITGDFKPGDSFWDHYLLTIVDHSDIYYPDGQIRDENYEFASFISSRMHHAGVRCMDCHDMHSMDTILPGNQLCMRCHTQGGFPNAPAILPEAHSFHQADSTGNQCINCHMPQTVYMQRHWRHDHGYTIPDPLLTQKFGIPNACNRCHDDQTTEWALEATEKWYGERMNRVTRTRATVFAKAREGDDSARQGLIDLLASDEIPYWKAAANLLLERWLENPAAQSALRDQLQHEHPLVRTTAIRSLEPLIDQSGTIRQAIEEHLVDPSRGVRVTAAWALRETVDLDSAAGKDLVHMLELNADQPSGQMQKGQFHYARGEMAKAIEHMKTATEWDPGSPPFHHDLAMIYSANGDTQRAVEKLKEAIRLNPEEAQYHYELGLAMSEIGELSDTITSLEKAVEIEPGFGRAWYNLGLARNRLGQTEAALEALRNGEKAAPNDPGIPYAAATIYAQQERKEEAMAAAQRALRIEPNFGAAQQLMMMLSR